MPRDSVFISLDKDIDIDHILAVLAALQGYEKTAEDKVEGWNSCNPLEKRTNNLDLYLHIPDTTLHVFFEKTLTRVRQISSQDIKELHDFSCIINVSLAEAITVAEANIKPLASAFGILLGCDTDSLPNVSNLDLSEYKPLIGLEYVVGKASFITYLACALHKHVIEIEPKPYLYKWSNPNYIAINNFSEKALKKAIAQCLSSIQKTKLTAQDVDAS